MPPPTYFTFYLYLKDGSKKLPMILIDYRRWSVPLSKAHLETLRKAKAKHGSAVLRLETCYMDNLQRLRAMVSDYRT
jgi:hypothetical protein